MTIKININEKFSKFSEHWRPKIVAELNGQEFKLAKIKGAQCPQSIWVMDCNVAPKSLAISDCAMIDKLTNSPRAEEGGFNMPNLATFLPLPEGEGPDRGVRGSKPLDFCLSETASGFGFALQSIFNRLRTLQAPHPPLRATFSPWEKGGLWVFMGEWV